MATALHTNLTKLNSKSNSTSATVPNGLGAWKTNIDNDIGRIIFQLNTIYYPLAYSLINNTNIEPLEKGLVGNTIFTHVDANENSSKVYWDSTLKRKRTIKETTDALLSELLRLEKLISFLKQEQVYDDTELVANIDSITSNLEQIILDTFGTNYLLNTPPAANQTYSLAQTIDALGSLFVGYVGTGNVYDDEYPALNLLQSSVEDLPADLIAIRDYTGMLSETDTPTYSTYNTVIHVSDGDSLTEAIAKLDSAIVDGTSYSAGGVLYANASDDLEVDISNFHWDYTNKRLGIGTSAPGTTLDVRGRITHNAGVVSYGGNARGTNANDFQITRLNATEVASGTRSFIAGGQNNTASGSGAFSHGFGNVSSGAYATTFGEDNDVSGDKSFATGSGHVVAGDDAAAVGSFNVASADWSTVIGSGAIAQLKGEFAHANGVFASTGDAQRSEILVRGTTNNATPQNLFIDGAAGTLPIVLQNNSTVGVVVSLAARDGAGNSNFYVLEGLFKRDANAASTTLVGSVTKRIIAEEIAAGDADLVADTTNGALAVQVTGTISATIKWVASVRMTRVM